MSRAAQQPRAPKRRISHLTEPSKPSEPEAYPTLVDPRDRISEPTQLELARDVLDFMADHLPLASVSGTVRTEEASQIIQPTEPVEPAVRSTEIDQLLHSPQSPQSSPLPRQTQPGLCPASPASLPEQPARPAKKPKRPKSDPILATNLLVSNPESDGPLAQDGVSLLGHVAFGGWLSHKHTPLFSRAEQANILPAVCPAESAGTR